MTTDPVFGGSTGHRAEGPGEHRVDA